ncbi:MAG: hypothetical protein ACYC55_02900 [Candidatus Geothermincolia bacterium]
MKGEPHWGRGRKGGQVQCEYCGAFTPFKLADWGDGVECWRCKQFVSLNRREGKQEPDEEPFAGLDAAFQAKYGEEGESDDPLSNDVEEGD